MKAVKIMTCMLLSFVVLALGVGYAQTTEEITSTGNVNFTHTSLYISKITTEGNVNILGYSETTLSLTAEKDSIMSVTITNPLSDTYYYLNYTAGDHKLNVSGVQLGTSIAPGGTVTLTVVFPEAVDHDHTVKFNFTVVPPVLEEPDDDGGVTTNATAIVEFVMNSTKYGLNLETLKNTFESWCTSTNRVLFCRDNGVSGGNLNKEYGEINAENVYYTLEWVSTTKYNLYLYYASEAENNLGKYIVVYRQEIVFNSLDNMWMTGDSFKGYGKMVKDINGNGIEHIKKEDGYEYVVWYASQDELPNGAQLGS